MPRTSVSEESQEAIFAPKQREIRFKTIFREISPGGTVPGSWNPTDFDGYVSSFLDAGWKVSSSSALGIRFDVDSKQPILSVFITLVKE